MDTRASYPTDVSDEEWAFAAPYLTLMSTGAPQRKHELREVFNALRWMVRAGAPWRLLSNDFPPWSVGYQQTHGWLDAGCFEAMVEDLRKRKKGSKLHIAVDTLGHLLALHVTPANEQDRTQVARLNHAVQQAPGEHA